MIILGIETSCDETAAAVVEKSGNRIHLLSNVVASSAALQAKYGGVIPEQAAREQIKAIIPVIEETLKQSNLYPPSSKYHLPSSTIHPPKIDAIAVTYGPGLIGSLLVGVETAKTLATVWNKPLIPVNHLIGHFYANWVESGSSPLRSNNKYSSSETKRSREVPYFPILGLLISGGHTDLVLFKNHGKYIYLGGTRDDAAGECFDKCARLLGLPYPGGPEISKLARKGNPKSFDLPRPMIDSANFDFSFSGLKTAVANLLHTSEVKQRLQQANTSKVIKDLCASIEAAIVDVLVAKTLAAAKNYKIEQIMIAGGVAANRKLVDRLQVTVDSMNTGIKLHIPPPNLCTDNAAMIASAAFFLPRPRAGQKPIKNPLSLQADPNLSL